MKTRNFLVKVEYLATILRRHSVATLGEYSNKEVAREVAKEYASSISDPVKVEFCAFDEPQGRRLGYCISVY